MKKLAAVLALALAFIAGAIVSAQVHDFQDLENVDKQIGQSIQGMERARAANHYDMEGHGAKADQLLRDAEHEVRLAIEAAKAHHGR